MKIVCFGDSNTYGYDARMLIDNRYPPEYRWVDILAKRTGWTWVNQGLNGREIPGYVISVPEDTDLFAVMLGTNDILQGKDSSAVFHRMDRFLGTLTFPPEKTLLIVPVPMIMGAWVTDESTVRYSRELSVQFKKLADKHGVRFVDTTEWGVELSYDGIHYTEAGQITFADRLYDYLIS